MPMAAYARRIPARIILASTRNQTMSRLSSPGPAEIEQGMVAGRHVLLGDSSE